MNDFLQIGWSWFNYTNFVYLFLKFLLDLVVIFVVIKLIYYRIRKNRSYLFTFTILNVIIFLLCSFLNHLTLSIGFSFGIFAIFSILRYRTISIPIKEMTYLFISITIAIINALSNQNVSIAELLFANFSIIFITFILEKTWMKNEVVKMIVYEKIELVKAHNKSALLDDLKERTGLNIHRLEIGKIDFLRDIAEIKVYYYSESADSFISEKDDDDED